MTPYAVRRAVARTALAGLAAVGALAGGPAYAADADVSTTASNTFSPASVTITPGDSVTWTNNGGLAHTVTSTSSNWSHDEPIPAPGTTTSFTFEDAGTYTYVCETHGAGMSGRVVVRATRPRPRPTVTSASPSRPPASPRPSATPPPGASPSAGVASPSLGPGGSPLPSASPSPSRPVVVAPPIGSAEATPYAGTGGLTPHPPVGRERGLPVLLAVLFLVGVIAAEVRTLLAQPIDREPPSTA